MPPTRRSFLAAPFAPALSSGALGEPAEAFAERRRRLAERVGRGLLALLGHDEHRGRSGFTGFRQESNFHYLTGHAEPGAALLIAPARGRDPYREALYLPRRDAGSEKWLGRSLSPTDAGHLGIARAAGAERLRRDLRTLLRDRKMLFGLRPRDIGETGRESDPRLEELAGTRDIRDLWSELAAMRSVKSESEIALLQRTVDATAAAYRTAWKAVESGTTERSVVAEFVCGAFRAGCERLAFAPMAGTGANAAILHYRKHSSVLREGQLLLMDAGGELSRYSADIARTVPVGGRFSSEQRRLYELVLGAQHAAIAAAGPGTVLNGPGPRSLLAVAERYMRERAPRGVDTHLPHALGHHVGLDVHDPAPPRAVLKSGMVVAIEPGIYLPKRGIGIRVEDMVEITADGCRVMSGGLPSSVDAIERTVPTAEAP